MAAVVGMRQGLDLGTVKVIPAIVAGLIARFFFQQ